MTATTHSLPLVIQGGMGVGVSSWVLAKAVSMRGQLGVVSGTALDSLFVRRLQDGDIGGHLRRAMERFPIPEVSADVLKRYFLPEGRPAGTPYKPVPMYRQVVTKVRHQLTMLANFCEVYLAKEEHDGLVGINLLTKVQMPNLGSLYGAMLAGVDYVLMGAGIPRQIPGILDKLARIEAAELRLDITGATEPVILKFDPAACGFESPPLKRPDFLAVVSSPVLAENLRRKASGKINGFVVEYSTAGGHNAPPRGGVKLGETGEPIYGPRDQVEPGKFREIGLPFWLAGGFGQAGKLREAQEYGAAGIQVGTAFALSRESGFDPGLKNEIIASIRRRDLKIFTDPVASPTGFPFKVANVAGTLADEEIYNKRTRICDIGVLREPFMKADGNVGFRCSAEPVDAYVAKGGDIAKTVGAKCLCNSLGASIGLGQHRSDGSDEAALITLGDDVASIAALLPAGAGGYSAGEVVARLLA
jgi:nitronate monooxygenase